MLNLRDNEISVQNRQLAQGIIGNCINNIRKGMSKEDVIDSGTRQYNHCLELGYTARDREQLYIALRDELQTMYHKNCIHPETRDLIQKIGLMCYCSE